MAIPVKAPAWGAVNRVNGGGLAKQSPSAPMTDQRLLYAMWDNERAANESAASACDVSDKLRETSAVIESLEAEVKELRDAMGELRELLAKLPEAIEEALAARA